MQLSFKVDAVYALAHLNRFEKRAAYVVQRALNDTAKDVQGQQRAHARRVLTLRSKADFILRQLSIIKFAAVKKGTNEATLSMTKKPRILLPHLEGGGVRPKFGKGKNVAVPTLGGPARTAKPMDIPEAFTFRGLRLKVSAKPKAKRRRRDVTFAAHTTNTGKRQIKGAHRTFILRSTRKTPHGGVFQRVGPKKGDIRLVYSFIPAPVLKATMRFIEIAKHVAGDRFAKHLQKNVERELREAAQFSRGGS